MELKSTRLWKLASAVKWGAKDAKIYLRAGAGFYKQQFFFSLRKKGIKGKFSVIERYKDIHKGERCFIMCSGPSLTLLDIEKLKNEITFVMNTFVKVLDDISYIPTYYAIQDGRVYSRIRENILEHKNHFKAMFVGSYFFKRDYYQDAEWIRFPQYFMGGVDNEFLRKKTPEIKFSEDPSEVVYDGGTIAYSILQIAFYMGFNEIYLIGADCEFKAGKKNDFTDREENMTEKDLNRDTGGGVESWLKGYMKAKECAEKRGIKIYNATRGGKLEVFPRIDLDEVIGIKNE